MNRRTGHIAAALCVAVAVVSPQLATAKWAAPHRTSVHRGAAVLAGPRYTPAELRALVAYSHLSLEQKKAVRAANR